MAPHEVYVIDSRAGDHLATVEWYPRWKRYVLSPEIGAVFSADCLSALVVFIESLERKDSP